MTTVLFGPGDVACEKGCCKAAGVSSINHVARRVLVV
jgi:hypothetical protein